jgi:cell wall assembly regulator SMI1
MTKDMGDDPIAARLGRLQRWLAKKRPNYARQLPPGASDADLAQLEKQLGKPLPPELRSLLAWHNGQGDGFIGAFEEDWLLLSAQDIAANKNDLEHDSGAGWDGDWIPLLANDAGDFLFLDTSQASRPVRHFSLGQTEHSIAAPSLAAWLRDFVENVERGHYVEDPERGRFLRQHAV